MGLRFGAEPVGQTVSQTADEAEVYVSLTPDTVTLFPGAHLGAEAGGLLCELVAATCTARIVEIDVARVRSFSRAGAAELLNCRVVGAERSVGVRHRASSSRGHQLLLAALRPGI
jgi:hypothetical protein